MNYNNDNMRRERRCLCATVEAREAKEGEPESRAIRGYAAVFDTDNSRLDQEGRGFTERLDSHCFDGVIERSDVCALYEHDYAPGILARSTNGKGTLKLSVDGKGLLCEFDAPHTSLGGRHPRECPAWRHQGHELRLHRQDRRVEPRRQGRLHAHRQGGGTALRRVARSDAGIRQDERQSPCHNGQGG